MKGKQLENIGDLTPDPRNARKHNQRNVGMVEAALREVGAGRSIVVDESGVILAGNATIKAAAKAGIHRLRVIDADGGEIIAVRRSGLTEQQKRRLALYDNRAAELAEWDADILRELEAADVEGMFDGSELDELLDRKPEGRGDADAEPKIDKAEELREQWGVEAGQLWQLGEHRLLCGDSANSDHVKRVLAGERVQVVFTDPPYGVSVGAKNRLLNSVQKAGRCLTDIESDDLTPEELKAKLAPAFVNVRTLAMADDCTVFVTAPQGGDLGMMMMMMMHEAGLPIRHVLIWKKNSPTFSMGRLDYDYQHEPILLTWGKRHKRPMMGQHKTSVWEIDKPRASAEHPTMKPVALMVNGLLNNSDTGDLCFEPFSGSGSTMIACEQTGRKCRAIEILPGYVAVALQRWADATGKTPERIDG